MHLIYKNVLIGGSMSKVQMYDLLIDDGVEPDAAAKMVADRFGDEDVIYFEGD